MFSRTIIKAMRDDAIARHPEESCGLVVRGVGYVACENRAEDRMAAFQIDPDIVLKHLRDKTLRAVIHSHPDPHPPVPSAADMQAQIDLDIPFGIVPMGPDGDAGTPFFWGDTVPVPPLIGRPYRHGVTDCYSICRDWYRGQGIHLRDYPRDWNQWQDKDNPDFHKRLYADGGFVEIDRDASQFGDAVLFSLNGRVSHRGILLEGGLLLHHPGGEKPYDPTRLSRCEPIKRWIPHIALVLRHKDWGKT